MSVEQKNLPLLILFVIPVAALAFDSSAISMIDRSPDIESYTCEGEEEAFRVFKQGLPYEDAFQPSGDVLSVDFSTEDGRILFGYMAKARDMHEVEVSPKGYVLLLPGNAMFAQHLIVAIRAFSRYGYDVYVYDYRGYGRSEGRSTVRALIKDARAIVSYLGRPTANGGRPYRKRNIYAVSAGAAIAINALDEESPIDRIVLDGTPASTSLDVRFLWLRLLYMKCPTELDPVNRRMPLAARSMVVSGKRDPVLKKTQEPALQRRLLERAGAAGACIVEQRWFGHPFQDAFTIRRSEMAAEFFEANLDAGCPSFPVYRE
jgi:hypothetical protein